MTEKIKFYYNPMSRAAIVHWMLEEAEAPYDLEVLQFKKGEHKTPEFLRINPMGKLPTIVHRGTVVTEAGAICAYVADQFPKNQLAPDVNSPDRGAYYRWLFFAAGCVEPAAMDQALGRTVPADKKGSIGYGSMDDTVAALKTALSPGPYILGNHFTAADVYVGSQLEWGMKFKSIEENEIFTAYVQRVRERPAYKRYESQSANIAAELG